MAMISEECRVLIEAWPLHVTCPKSHLSEMELCRFRNLTLALTLTLCLYVSDKN